MTKSQDQKSNDLVRVKVETPGFGIELSMSDKLPKLIHRILPERFRIRRDAESTSMRAPAA